MMKHIYEIHTAAWLSRLSDTYKKPMTLGTVPAEEIDSWVAYGIDTIWLMGIWERSPLAAEINASDDQLKKNLTSLLPDFTEADIIGSAYAVKSYTVDKRFGDEDQLAHFRSVLAQRGLKLLLDFVPNHTAFDHSWVGTYPDYYIHARPDDTAVDFAEYRNCAGVMVAMGKDPTLEPWHDVAQANAYSTGYRTASIETLRHIATLCDGVRCDMAMLMLNRVVSSAWGRLAGPVPRTEYWTDIIHGVHETAPAFVFIAEAYWQTERRLIELGFDYCYDKTTYDMLVRGDMRAAKSHLDTLSDISRHLLHFLENHDEQRAASIFSAEHALDYARYISALPGACLWYDGQFEGYAKHIPVHVRRGPVETPNPTLAHQYKDVLTRRD